MLDHENAVAGDPVLDPAMTHCYAARRNEQTLAALVECDDDMQLDADMRAPVAT